MNPEFVNRIEEPRKIQLQKLQADAKEIVSERLKNYRMWDVPDHVIQKMTYAYYHDWIQDDPSYVFLLADPGVPGEHVIFETNQYLELGDNRDPHDAVQVDRRFGARWLVKQEYTDFTEEFVALCRKWDLITGDAPWWRYVLSGGFFDDFYMTDVIKYRGVSPGSGDIAVSFSETLIHELEYVDPDLVFSFGKRAWETLTERLGLQPIASAPESRSVTDVHGVPHEATRLIETTVLPAGHPSPNFRGSQFAHEEYMNRLSTGLQTGLEH